MRPVNLLPGDFQSTRRRLPKGQLLLAGTAPLVAAAFVYLGYSYEHAKVVDARTEVDVAQTELNGLGPAATVGAAGRQLATVRLNKLHALQDALSRRVAWDLTLDQISRVLPADSWLTQLSAQSPTPTTTSSAAPTGTTTSTASTASSATLSITGYSHSTEGVAHVLARLALVPTLANVALTATTTAVIGGKSVVQFQITATILPGGNS